MNKFISFLTCMVVALIFALGYQSIVAQDSMTPATVKIGVVDVAKVLRDCRASVENDKVIKEKSQEIRAKLETLKSEIEALQQEIQMGLKPGSEEHKKSMQEWFNKQALQEAYEKGQLELLSSERQAWIEELYQTLIDQTATVARQQQLTLVLDKDSSDFKPTKMSELFDMIRTRKVIYNKASIDITGLVIEKMDQVFENSK